MSVIDGHCFVLLEHVRTDLEKLVYNGQNRVEMIHAVFSFVFKPCIESTFLLETLNILYHIAKIKLKGNNI